MRVFKAANLGILKYIRICISANLENIEITYTTYIINDIVEYWQLTGFVN